ncbi:hypothetical protein BO99DRAFT_193698 [Aspergillus violaceofuscus CBS 115571]|uniref:Secreted protein n=1 Tax=Aspergillus violaceofuscus (strain CBS 115571) TaxID=1450538 RepID=A0A2V5ICG6_ASPV1|nr:hypothetical protein BO99DRAFT_193698 [Aspergillus violaceofuscus CBS 115571]
MARQLLTVIVFRALLGTHSGIVRWSEKKKLKKKKGSSIPIKALSGPTTTPDDSWVCDAWGFYHPHRTMPVGTGKPLCCVVPWHSKRPLLPLVGLRLDYQFFVFAVGKVVCGGMGFLHNQQGGTIKVGINCWW